MVNEYGMNMVKNPPVNAGVMRPGFEPWVGKMPWRRRQQPTPGFLPGESQGQRSLGGYSQRGHKESDTTSDLALVVQAPSCVRLFMTPWIAARQASLSHHFLQFARLGMHNTFCNIDTNEYLMTLEGTDELI